MGRGAPNKKGLDYFPKMTDFYEDDKIFDLLDKYGPLGVTIYDCILCIVYKNGYYAEISLDKLSRMIVRMIGNKWVKGQKAVVQVVHFCSEIGLLDDDLVSENIITSVGIQRRYYEIAVKRMKRQLYTDKYWLLGKEEDGEPFLKSPKNQISSEENRIISEENRITSEESPIEIKKKRNIGIYAVSPLEENVEKAFRIYLDEQKEKERKLSENQIVLLRKHLCEISKNPEEQVEIINESIRHGWKDFYPLRKNGVKKIENRKRNAFNDFPQREYNFEQLEKSLCK